jgi:DNA-binding transcriptional regulator LsrR (DeoR family)
LESEI